MTSSTVGALRRRKHQFGSGMECPAAAQRRSSSRPLPVYLFAAGMVRRGDDAPSVRRGVLSRADTAELLRVTVRSGRHAFSASTALSRPNRSLFVLDICARGEKRRDVLLSGAWERAMVRSCAPFAKLSASLRPGTPVRSLQMDWHLFVVESGAPAQDWHRDAPRSRRYRTHLVALTHDPPDSGTEFCSTAGGVERCFILNELGGIVSFSGRSVHRGTAHRGAAPRLFLYAVVYSGADPNREI